MKHRMCVNLKRHLLEYPLSAVWACKSIRRAKRFKSLAATVMEMIGKLVRTAALKFPLGGICTPPVLECMVVIIIQKVNHYAW